MSAQSWGQVGGDDVRREECTGRGAGVRLSSQTHAQEHGSGLGPHKRVAPSLRAICHLPHHNNINNNSYTQGASDDVWWIKLNLNL